MQFTSTAREDVNRPGAQTVDGFDTVRPEDPKPWYSDLVGDRFVEGEPGAPTILYGPRPGYRAPQNPILAAFRAEPSNPADWLGALDDEVHEDGAHHCWHHVQIVESDATPEHIEHARKVLTRLVNMFKED